MTTSNNTVDLNAQGWYLDSSPTPLLGTWNNQSNEVIVNTNDPTAVQVKSNDTVNTGKGKDVISGTATNNTAQDVYGVLIAGTLNASGGNDSITGNATGTQVVNGILVTGILNTGTGKDNITGIAYGSNQLNSNQVFGICDLNQINLGTGNNQLNANAYANDIGNTNAEVLKNGGKQDIWSYGLGDSYGNLIGDGSSWITAGDGNNLIEGTGFTNGILPVTSDVNGVSPTYVSVGIQLSTYKPHSITVGNGNNKIIGNANDQVSPISSTPLSVQYSNFQIFDFGISISHGDSIQTGNGNNEITGNAKVEMSNFDNSGPNSSFEDGASGIGIGDFSSNPQKLLGSIKLGSGNTTITGNANVLSQVKGDSSTGGSESIGIEMRYGTINAGDGFNQITGNANLSDTGGVNLSGGGTPYNSLFNNNADDSLGIVTDSFSSINIVNGNINGNASATIAKVIADKSIQYSALDYGIDNYGKITEQKGNVSGNATANVSGSSSALVYGIFNDINGINQDGTTSSPGKITLVDGDITGKASATVTSPVASANPTQVDGIYNTGTISITGDKNDSITGTGSTYGIYNSGTISLTGKGNDTVTANGGFGGNGTINLGSGKDTVIGFGNQTVIGGGGTDTLKLLSGTYTVGSANTSNGINGSFTTLSSNGATMYLEGFTNLVVGNKSFNFNNLGSIVTG